MAPANAITLLPTRDHLAAVMLIGQKQDEVRDFVALEIARFLGIEVELNLDRTSDEWAKIRRQVEEVLKRELGKTD